MPEAAKRGPCVSYQRSRAEPRGVGVWNKTDVCRGGEDGRCGCVGWMEQAMRFVVCKGIPGQCDFWLEQRGEGRKRMWDAKWLGEAKGARGTSRLGDGHCGYTM